MRLILLTFLMLSSTGHFRLRTDQLVKPRSADDGLKNGPCGNIPAETDASKLPTLYAGDELELKWEETINHPGWYRIAYSITGEDTFDENVILDNIIDDQNGQVNRNDPSTYHQFSKTITVPEVNCARCTIQMIQVMTNTNPPSNYYSCADVKIVIRSKDVEIPSAPKSLKLEIIKVK